MLKKVSVVSFAGVLFCAGLSVAWGAPAVAPAPKASAATAKSAPEHPGKSFIEQNGYEGPKTCENCHPGKAAEFINTVHWKHRSPAPAVKGVDQKQEYGMYNRVYSFCNGNDVVNKLKETPVGSHTNKTTLSGCNTCHPGNNIYGPESSGKEAEESIDCLVCHSSTYDFSKRKPSKDEQGRVVMLQDRSREAALTVGKPGVKNCMACHEKAGGGALIKRGFDYRPEVDVHAANKMVCVDCHKGKNHKIPTGDDPNNWASDNNERISCLTCHDAKPHKKNKHLAARPAISRTPAARIRRISRSGSCFPTSGTSRRRWKKGPRKRFRTMPGIMERRLIARLMSAPPATGRTRAARSIASRSITARSSSTKRPASPWLWTSPIQRQPAT
jgi:hypothetical protein